MSTVNLSAASRTGLNVLRSVADEMAKTQNRLVTGKAVNSPLDNVSKFFTAASMDSRAASIDSLMDNIKSAQSTMKAASEGIKGIQGLIKEARALTSQALTASVKYAEVASSKTVTTATDVIGAAPGLGMTAGETLTVSDGTTTATFTAAAGNKISDVVTAINNTANFKGVASVKDGKLTITGTSNVNLTIAGTGADDLGFTAGTTNFTDNATRVGLAKQFDALRTEIDRIAKDSGINGTNLLQGDKITLALNENGSSSTTISGTSVSSSSLNVTASANKWQSDTDVNASLTNLINAASSLESTAASFSSNQSIINARAEFNASLSDILKSASSDLTAADMDQEAANLVALQTRQQMASTSLSIIRSSETTALRLLS